MVQSSTQERIKDQNDAYFLAILLLILILELFFWWYCPITAVFGALIVIPAYVQTRRRAWTDKSAIGYGLIVIISWAFILGALEVYWFQNLSITYNLFYWFSSPVPYWLFMLCSGFFVALLVSRSVLFSLIATAFYSALED